MDKKDTLMFIKILYVSINTINLGQGSNLM